MAAEAFIYKLERLIKEVAKRKQTKQAYFSAIITPNKVHKDCKHLKFTSTKASNWRTYWGFKHPICRHPEKINEYLKKHTLITSCKDCPYYENK